MFRKVIVFGLLEMIRKKKKKKKNEDRVPGSKFGLQVGLGTAMRAFTFRWY